MHLGQLIKSIQWTSLDDLYWLIHVAFDFLPVSYQNRVLCMAFLRMNGCGFRTKFFETSFFAVGK